MLAFGVWLITLISSAWSPYRNVLLELFLEVLSMLTLIQSLNPILKTLKFEDIVFLQVAKIMYLYKNGQLPESFKNMFFTGQEIHNYNTRNSNIFRLPSCRTNVRKFSLRFQGPKIFNSINDEIKNSLSLREFTSKVKSTFLV